MLEIVGAAALGLEVAGAMTPGLEVVVVARRMLGIAGATVLVL